MKTIAVAADHVGFSLKEACKANLIQLGFQVQDFGTHSENSVDYPDVVHPLANYLRQNPEIMAVLICGSGQGVCMTANRYSHLRAALCWDKKIAILARQHNNANVLCLPARFLAVQQGLAVLKAFLETPFEEGRHLVRINKINPETNQYAG